MPLVFSRIGERKRVQKINGDAGFIRRINNMGLVEGDEIFILSIIHGNIVVVVKETKLAISYEAAANIQVI